MSENDFQKMLTMAFVAFVISYLIMKNDSNFNVFSMMKMTNAFRFGIINNLNFKHNCLVLSPTFNCLMV